MAAVQTLAGIPMQEKILLSLGRTRWYAELTNSAWSPLLCGFWPLAWRSLTTAIFAPLRLAADNAASFAAKSFGKGEAADGYMYAKLYQPPSPPAPSPPRYLLFDNRPIGTEALQPIVDNSRMIQLKTEQRTASVNTRSNLHRHNCPHGASKEELAAQASLVRGSPCTLVPLLWLSVLFGDRSKRHRFRLIVSPLPHA